MKWRLHLHSESKTRAAATGTRESLQVRCDTVQRSFDSGCILASYLHPIRERWSDYLHASFTPCVIKLKLSPVEQFPGSDPPPEREAPRAPTRSATLARDLSTLYVAWLLQRFSKRCNVNTDDRESVFHVQLVRDQHLDMVEAICTSTRDR